jgi:hypothetical protein
MDSPRVAEPCLLNIADDAHYARSREECRWQNV